MAWTGECASGSAYDSDGEFYQVYAGRGTYFRFDFKWCRADGRDASGVERNPIYIPNRISNEFLYSVRFREGGAVTSDDCTGSRGVRNIFATMCGSICIWRWIFERVLPYEPGAAYQSRACGCELREMGEVELEVPSYEFGVDKSYFACGINDWILRKTALMSRLFFIFLSNF